ncbi:MAG: hypothetical protein ACRDJN_29620 [Chloroflexota bacterium]
MSLLPDISVTPTTPVTPVTPTTPAGARQTYTAYTYWTKARMLDALRRWYAAEGTTPTGSPEWDAARHAAGRAVPAAASPVGRSSRRSVYPSSASILRYWPSLRRAWLAAGLRDALGEQPHGNDVWTDEEDTYLRRWWGLVPDAEVAAQLGRTINGVHLHAQRKLGLNRLENACRVGHAMTVREVAALFGCDPSTPVRSWAKRGWLPVVRSAVQAGPDGTAWLCCVDCVRQFVLTHGWAYDWRRMQPGHPLTDLAREVNTRDPWLTQAEVTARYGRSPTFLKHWRERGFLPFRRRPKQGTRGGSMVGLVVYRQRDLEGPTGQDGAFARIAAVKHREASAAARRRMRRYGPPRQWSLTRPGKQPWLAEPGDRVRCVREVPAGRRVAGRQGTIQRVFWTYRTRRKDEPPGMPAQYFWAAEVQLDPLRPGEPGTRGRPARRVLPLDALVWLGPLAPAAAESAVELEAAG